MLAPVGGVSSTAPIPSSNRTPFDTGIPVAALDARQLQLERQLQNYNRQLAVAQEAARQAEQLRRRIAAVQLQLEERRLETLRAADRRQRDVEEEAAAEQLRTDNLLAEQQAEDLRAAELTEERLVDERLAADRLAADQLADAQSAPVVEPQIRLPAIDTGTSNEIASEQNNAGGTNEDLIPPLVPDDSGRLINTLV